MHLKQCFLSLLACLGLAACPAGDSHEHADDEHHQHEPTGGIIPLKGTTAQSDNYIVSVVSASFDPAEEGMNDWVLRLEDHDRNLISNATIVAVPFMSVHNHVTNPASFTATAAEEEGEYELNDVNFIMPGPWEVTFTVTVDNGTDGGTMSEDAMMELTVIN